MFLTKSGVAEPRLMTHARWGSAAIRRYTRRAHEWGLVDISTQAAGAAASCALKPNPALTDWTSGAPLEGAPSASSTQRWPCSSCDMIFQAFDGVRPECPRCGIATTELL